MNYDFLAPCTRNAGLVLAILGLGMASAHPVQAQSKLFGLAPAFGNANLYTINPATGAETLVRDVNTGRASNVSLAYLNGALYTTNFAAPISPISFGTINPTTGTFTPISSQGTTADFAGLAADPTANLFYTVNNQGDTFETISPTGTFTAIGATGLKDYVAGVAYDAMTGTIYAETSPGNLYTISKATGAASLIGSFGLPSYSASDIAIDPDNGGLYLNLGHGTGVQSGLYTVNRLTAAATFVGSNGPSNDFGSDGIAFAPAAFPAPEASTTVSFGLLLALGLGGLIIVARRKRTAVKASSAL